MTYFVDRACRGTFMLLLWVILIGLVQACKQDAVVDPGFGPDGEPRLLSVKIPGIPDQNIYVDQTAKQIIATVPTSFSAGYIMPVFTLTPSTTLTNGQHYGFDVATDASQYPITLKTTGNKTSTYTVVLKPAGELAFGTLSGPQSYSVGDSPIYIRLPVYNYVDGLGYQSSTVTLINKASGERTIANIVVTGRTAVGDQLPQTDGAIVLSVYFSGFETYYKPGDYTVELAKTNGRKATSQTVQLLKGPTTAHFNANYVIQLNSGDYLLYGSDFYREDKVSLRIQGRDQPALTVDALGFIDKQPGIRLPTALPLKPGYYYAQLIVNGVPTSSIGRITVSDQAKPLLIESLSERDPYKSLVDPSYSFGVPIPVRRGAVYGINSNGYLFATSDGKSIRRVRLTLLTDRTKQYDIPIAIDPSLGIDKLVVPATVPVGGYEMKVQVVRSDGTIVEGIPLERDVVVQ